MASIWVSFFIFPDSNKDEINLLFLGKKMMRKKEEKTYSGEDGL